MPKPAKLICVDDDPDALERLGIILNNISLRLTCEFFGSPKKALESHRADPASIVISDLRMGSTTGLKLIEEMRPASPESIYMLLSGEADLDSALAAVNGSGEFRFFTKPAGREEIEKGLLDALAELQARKLRAAATSTLDAIDRMHTALVNLDIDGVIVFSNAHADRLLEDSGLFQVDSKRVLRARNPQDTQKFQAFLTRLASDERTDGYGVFRFSDPESGKAVIASAAVVPGRRARFSLVLTDPANTHPANARLLAAALDLTPSEARVVQGLIEGGSIESAATLAGVTVATARSYLKSVFAKTGVSKQAELVRLALTSLSRA